MEPPFAWAKSVSDISARLKVHTTPVTKWLEDHLLPHVEIIAEDKVHRFAPIPYLTLLGSTVRSQPLKDRRQYLVDFSRAHSNEIAGLHTAFSDGIATLLCGSPVNIDELAQFFGYSSGTAGKMRAWCIFTMQDNIWAIDPKLVAERVVWRSAEA